MSRIAKLVRTLKKYENFAALKPLLSLGTLVGIILLAAAAGASVAIGAAPSMRANWRLEY